MIPKLAYFGTGYDDIAYEAITLTYLARVSGDVPLGVLVAVQD